MADTLAELREIYNKARALAADMRQEMDEHTERGEFFMRDPYKNDELERMKGVLTNALPDIFARIEALEAGLRFFAGAYARWQKELADGDASNDFLTWAINNGGLLDNVDGAFESAYDLLRAENGGEG